MSNNGKQRIPGRVLPEEGIPSPAPAGAAPLVTGGAITVKDVGGFTTAEEKKEQLLLEAGGYLTEGEGSLSSINQMDKGEEDDGKETFYTPKMLMRKRDSSDEDTKSDDSVTSIGSSVREDGEKGERLIVRSEEDIFKPNSKLARTPPRPRAASAATTRDTEGKRKRSPREGVEEEKQIEKKATTARKKVDDFRRSLWRVAAGAERKELYSEQTKEGEADMEPETDTWNDYERIIGKGMALASQLQALVNKYPNTQKEIKTHIKNLSSTMREIKEEEEKIKKMTHQHRKRETREAETATDKPDTGNKQTQTDSRDRVQEVEILKAQEEGSYEAFLEINKRTWEKEDYLVTETCETSPPEAVKIYVKSRKSKNDNNAIDLLLGEANDTGLDNIIKISANTGCGKIKELYYIQTEQEDNKIAPQELYGNLHRLKETLNTHKHETVAFHKIELGKRKTNTGIVRRMIETAFRNAGIKVFYPVAKKKRQNNPEEKAEETNTEIQNTEPQTEGAEWTQARRTRKPKAAKLDPGVKATKARTRKRDTDAIVVTMKGADYSEVVKRVKKAVPQDKQEAVRGIRKTRRGDLLIEISKSNPDAAKEVQEKIRSSVGEEKTKLLTNRKKKTVIIRDIVEGTDAEEILTDIRKHAGEDVQLDIKSIFPTRRGTISAFIEVSEKANGDIPVKEGDRIRIGLAICRVERYLVVRRCYKCQQYDHTGKECTSTNDLSKSCRKCSEAGHKEDHCTKPEYKCLSCGLNHRCGTGKCAIHRRALEEARKADTTTASHRRKAPEEAPKTKKYRKAEAWEDTQEDQPSRSSK